MLTTDKRRQLVETQRLGALVLPPNALRSGAVRCKSPAVKLFDLRESPLKCGMLAAEMRAPPEPPA